MASNAMNRLMDNARSYLPGALDSAIQAELFSVVKQFCNETNVWEQEFEFEVSPVEGSFLDDPDAFTYQIYPPAGARTVRIRWVRDANNAPVKAGMPRADYIQVASSPNEEQTYKAVVTLEVTDPVTREGYPVVPDWLIEKYNDGLLEGVLARMMSQPAKPYTAVAMASYHAAAFRSAISRARIEADRRHTQGGQAWRFPQSFNRAR